SQLLAVSNRVDRVVKMRFYDRGAEVGSIAPSAARLRSERFAGFRNEMWGIGLERKNPPATALERRPPQRENLQGGLALGVRRSQLGVGCCPDALDAAAGAQEKGGRSQRYESHQQRILDQVLALLVFDKVCEEEFHVSHLKMSLG